MWDLADVGIGDFIKVQIVNKHGDRNLDGIILEGIIKDLVPDKKFACLDSGWCVYTKDTLLEYKKASS